MEVTCRNELAFINILWGSNPEISGKTGYSAKPNQIRLHNRLPVGFGMIDGFSNPATLCMTETLPAPPIKEHESVTI
jgi:hypothetical protein